MRKEKSLGIKGKQKPGKNEKETKSLISIPF